MVGTLAPEQLKALAYLRTRGTEEPMAAVRDRVGRAFADLETALACLDETTARRAPAPSKWCAQEVVDHLIESHRPAIDQLAAMIAGRRPEGDPIPASLLSAEVMVKSWGRLVADLHDVHRHFLAVLDQASDTCDLSVTTPVVMVVKVATPDGGLETREWLHELGFKAYAVALAAHTREHQAQIARAVESTPRA
jgi:hypothetical protein